MKLRNKKKETIENHPLLTRLVIYTGNIAGRLSLFLQKKTERLSYRTKRKWLILFCVLGIGCSISVIGYSFITIQPSIIRNNIRLPAHLVNLPYSSQVKDSFITALQYKRIQHFEQYLERQKNDASGKLFYDSLISARPHLLDSLRTIDSLFLSQ